MIESSIFNESKRLRSMGLSWDEISEELNKTLDLNLSPDTYRKKFTEMMKGYEIAREEFKNSLSSDEAEAIKKQTLELKKERVKIADERRGLNLLIRELSRAEVYEEKFKEALMEATNIHTVEKVSVKQYDKEALLMISDAHVGAQCDNTWNRYNLEIFHIRLNTLISETIERAKLYGVKKLHVVDLGDAIEGLIHVTTRIDNVVDVVEQTKIYAEAFTKAIEILSESFEEVHVHMTRGNHSRVSPNKKDSVDKESFEDIIAWFTEANIKGMANVFYHENTIHDEIILMNVLGHKIVGVHGHKHNPQTVDKVMSTMLGYNPDYILMGHRHHLSEREDSGIEVIQNASMKGVDEYAISIGKVGKAGQKLLVFDEKGRYSTHNIVF